MEAIKAKAKALAQEIEDFDKACKAAEYTDTGDAWELLERIQKGLQEIASS